MMNQQDTDLIKSAISAADNIAVIAHKNPDGDATGSLLAVDNFLNNINKQHTLLTPNSPSVQFDFLINARPIEHNFLNLTNFDLIITLDCADEKQAGIENRLAEIKTKKIKIINIDHHLTNSRFGEINLVLSDASSTSEIIFSLLRAINSPIDENMATALMTGVLTDTSNFSNAATTFSSMKVAAELLKQGARMHEIMHHTLKNKSLGVLKLWGKVLLRLEEIPQSGIVVTVITLDDLKEAQVDKEAVEGVANFLNILSRTKAILVLREEQEGIVKGSLRTTDDQVDVSKIAKLFGGGGHKKAAGFTIKGHLVETDRGWRIE